MEFIAHRINTIEELKQVPTEYGVELDLRDFGERLVLQHDPFKDGEDFEEGYSIDCIIVSLCRTQNLQ